MLTLVPRSRIFLPWRWGRYVLPKRQFSQDAHGATSQNTAFFIVTAVKTSNPTSSLYFTCRRTKKVKKSFVIANVKPAKRNKNKCKLRRLFAAKIRKSKKVFMSYCSTLFENSFSEISYSYCILNPVIQKKSGLLGTDRRVQKKIKNTWISFKYDAKSMCPWFTSGARCLFINILFILLLYSYIGLSGI
jgi:hypothetical protein